MADHEWSWPTRIDRDAVESALRLEFIDTSDGANLRTGPAEAGGKTVIDAPFATRDAGLRERHASERARVVPVGTRLSGGATSRSSDHGRRLSSCHGRATSDLLLPRPCNERLASVTASRRATSGRFYCHGACSVTALMLGRSNMVSIAAGCGWQSTYDRPAWWLICFGLATWTAILIPIVRKGRSVAIAILRGAPRRCRSGGCWR